MRQRRMALVSVTVSSDGMRVRVTASGGNMKIHRAFLSDTITSISTPEGNIALGYSFWSGALTSVGNAGVSYGWNGQIKSVGYDERVEIIVQTDMPEQDNR